MESNYPTRNNRNIFSTAILSLALFLLPSLTMATHIVGGALTYVYNGGSSYTVTLKLYRDCGTGSAALPGTVTIQVRGYNGATFTPSRNFTMALSTTVNLPSNLDTCAIPPNPIPCVQEGTYTTTVVNLPPNAGGYHLYYQVCCRNLTTINVDCTCNCIGESFYAYIPGMTMIWLEEFTMANGTTVDVGPTAWTRTLGTPAPNYAQVQNNLFEWSGINNAQATWLSQSINIAAFTAGVNLSVNLAENGTMDANDSILVYYRLNGGPLTPFAVNPFRADDFTTAVSTSGPMIGTTVEIVVRVHYDGASPTSELYRIDNVMVFGNDFVANSNPVFTLFPPLFLCQGDPFTFNHVAADPDGDVLVYSLYTPYTDAAFTYLNNAPQFQPVTYQPSYSFTSPLGAPPLSLNAATGLLSGTPAFTGQFIVGVKVQEFRASVLLSETVRDFQFNVVNCPPPAQASISVTPLNACNSTNYCFPNISDTIATNWWWDFGNPLATNDTSILEFPCYNYPNPGTYTVTLIINKGTSCADTATAIINVSSVTAAFTHNAPQCALSNVTFTNTSTSSINSTIAGYLWDFGDTQTSTLTNPTHAYATGGTYTVTLTATNSFGCTSSTTAVITINPTPAPPVASSSSPDCSGQTLSLFATLVPSATYSWTGPNSFSSSLQNPTIPSVTVAASGVYTVTVTVGGCTSPTATTTVVINPTPAAPTPSSNTPVCSGQTLNLFSNTVPSATYSWTGPNSFSSALEDPSIPSVTTAASGIYTVTVTVSGCTSPTATTTVVINATPAAPVATSNAPICAGLTLNLFASAIPSATYSWTGPNSFSSSLQNPSIPSVTTAASGIYTVTATVNGCTGPAGTVNVLISNAPAAPVATSNSPICAGQTLTLFASTIPSATYNWTGPNSFTSTLQNPTIINATTLASGIYTVTATVAGCTGPGGTTTVVVNATPVAPVPSSNSPVCAGSTLNLFSNTVPSATYSWTGPNSFSSALEDPSIPSVTTAASGVYTVTVTVGGCTSPTATTTVVVNAIPSAPVASSNSPVCTGQTLTLFASTIPSATYSWTGPNSFSSALQNPTIASVTALAAGTYTVTATVSGCTSPTATTVVVVNTTPAAPVASSNTPVCAGGTLNLFATLIPSATYTWTGPNSFSSALQNPSIPSVTTAASGIYTVTVTVGGCTSPTATTTVVINAIPAAPVATSNSPVCIGLTLNLFASTIPSATYSWTGPNSFSSSLQNPTIPSVTAAAAGIYTVTATVNGCTGPGGTVTVVINNPPAAPTASSNSPVCTGQTLTLFASTIPSATYSWVGPNSFTSILQNPTIASVTALAAGTYTVTANVGGCNSPTATTTVVVNATPVAPVISSNSPVCEGSTLNLFSNTVPSATYSWTGPNSFSSALEDPSIPSVTVAASGVYTVTVTVNGCTSPTATTTVVISITPVANAGPDQTVCGNNATITLAGTSTTGTGIWSGGTGTYVPNNTTLNATYTPSAAEISAGTVTLTLTTTNNGACAAANDQMVITITPAPTVNAGVNQSVCANNSVVTLNAVFTVSTGVIWSSSGTGVFTPLNTSNPVTYTPSAADILAGTVTITVTTTGNGTCLAVTDQMIITITPAPVVNAGPDDSTCTNNPNALLAGSVTGPTTTGIWSSSGTGSFTPSNTTLNATYLPTAGDLAAGFVVLTLTSTGNGNCIAVTDQMTLVFTQPPTVNAGPDVSVCGNNASVLLSGTSTTTTGTWTTSGSGTFTPNPNTLNATYNPSAADIAAGTITLTLTSTNNGGCLAVTDQMIITITPAPTVSAGPDQSVCSNNANVNLTAIFTVSTGVLWSSSGTGTFTPTTSSNPVTYVPSPADTTAGTVTIYVTTTGNGNCNGVIDSMVITITNAPLVNAGPNIITCLSTPNTPLNGSSNTGSGTWTTLGCGTFTPNPNTLNATYVPCTADTVAGTVTLILTSTNNGACNAVSDTLVITYQNIPTVNAGSNQTVCANNAIITLNGTSSTGTGIWTTSGTGVFLPNPNTLNGTYVPSPADTTAGTVTLTLTSTNGCIPVSQSIVITITPAPGVNAGPDQTVCANNPNVTLNGNVFGSSTTGNWTSNGTGAFVPNPSTLNGTYVPSPADTTAGTVILVLTSTNNGNCNPVTDTMIVTIISQPTALAGPDDTVCANNLVQLNGIILQGSGTGIWTTNGTGTFVPNATTLITTYVFSAADTTLSSLMFILTSTNNGNCFADADTMIVTITPAPVVNAGPDQTVCANNAIVTLNGSVTGMTTSGQWSSSGTGIFLPNNTTLNGTYTPSPADTLAGTVTLVLSSTNNGNCLVVTDTMIITITNAPLVNAGPNIFICTGTMFANLNGSVTGGSSTGTWTTLGSGTFTPNPNALNGTYNLSQADSLAGVIILILTSTNNGSCNPVSDTVVITVTTIPTVFAGNDTTVCDNAPIVQLNGIVVGGGGTGQWTTSGSGTFNPSDTTLTATYTPSGADILSGTVTLVLTATNSCLPVSDTVVITIIPGPSVTAPGNFVVCGATPVNLNGSFTNATGLLWSSSGTGMFTPNDSALSVTYTPSAADVTAGTVTIYLTSTGNGICTADVDTLTIAYGAQPTANFIHGPACLGMAVTFTDTSTVSNGTIVSWSWDFGTGTSSAQDTVFTFLTTGNQTVTLIVTSNAGCVDTITMNVYVNPLPTALWSYTTSCPDSAHFTDASSINPGAITTWGWSFGDSTFSALQNPSHSYPGGGSFGVTLVVTSDSGCIATFSDTVTITICDDEFHDPVVPSAFTPNGDNLNDILFVLGGPFKSVNFRIYNEWGNEIFRSSSQSVGWDGTYKKKPQPGGTYIWIVDVMTMDDRRVKKSGDVTIIR